MATTVSGLQQVNARLNRELSRIGGPMTERFITEALIQTAARTAYYIPVDTSFLINSQFRNIKRAQDGWMGEMGYSAGYAVPVHEGPDKNWKKAGASNKFLEKGLKEMIDEDLQELIRRSYNL